MNQITKTQEKLPDSSIIEKTIYQYDLNGNLVKEKSATETQTQTTVYSYDFENRLTKVTTPENIVEYEYDSSGRRIQLANRQTGKQVNFIYDAPTLVSLGRSPDRSVGSDQIIAEYDSDNNLIAKYVYGTGIDEPIRMEKGGQSYYYHFDGLGSVTGITGLTGETLETYEYDVYGQPNITSSVGNRYMFTGREYDEQTGLYYYRARYYSPSIGRFLQRDPIGYIAGINLYTYCNNNPINWIDPWGLEKENKLEFGRWLFPIEIQVSFNPAEAYAAAYGPFVILYGPLYRAQHPLVRESIKYHELIHTKQWGWGLRDIVDVIQKRSKSREIEAYEKQKEFIQEKIKNPAIDTEGKKALENFLEDIEWFIANPESM